MLHARILIMDHYKQHAAADDREDVASLDTGLCPPGDHTHTDSLDTASPHRHLGHTDSPAACRPRDIPHVCTDDHGSHKGDE